MIKTKSIVVLIAMISSGFTVPALCQTTGTPYARAGDYFARTYVDFHGTLRVGYHMTSEFKSYYDDRPGKCQEFGAWMYSYSGDLPPGIQFHPSAPPWSDGKAFSGTPRQPGRWTGTLDVEFGCGKGIGVARYRYLLPVEFKVDP